MKKLVIIAAASLLALTACGPKQTNAEKMQAYQDAVAQIVQAAEERAQELQSDTSLTLDALDLAMESISEELYQQVIDLGLATMKSNPKDSVALFVLQDIYYMAEPEDIESAIKGLSQDLQNSEFAQSVLQSIESKKLTAEGMMFTDFTVVQDAEDPAGSTVKLSDYVGKGKYILVDFWASWCGPCKAELPNIKNVYETYAGDKFDVLSIAVWDEVEDTKAAAEELGITWNQIINGLTEPTDIYGIDGIPHIILFGPDGTILKRDLRGEALENAVKEALGL